MIKKSLLETDRLILRIFETTDLESMHRYRSLPQVFRYVVSDPKSRKATANFIKYAIAVRKKKPVLNYIWAVVSKKNRKSDRRLQFAYHQPRSKRSLSRLYLKSGFLESRIRDGNHKKAHRVWVFTTETSSYLRHL